MPSTADLLHQLHRLLDLPDDASAPTALSLAVLQVWKPRAEQIARARQSDALEIARLLREAAAASDDPACIAYAGWICGNIFHNLGAMKQADDAYRQANALYGRLGDPLSAARMSVGWVHVLGELGEGAAALQCADRAAAILHNAGDASDAVRLAHLYGNRGIVHEQMGQFVKALADYQHKLAFFQSLPDRTPEAMMDAALVLNDIGVIHTLLGQYNDADAIFQQALARLAPYADMPFVDADRTLVLMNVAWLKVQRHNPPALVRRAFQQARASRDRLSEQSERLFFAAIELDEANYLIRDGRWQEVGHAALIALRAQLLAQGDEFNAAYAGLLLGQLVFHVGEQDAALAWFEQVAQSSREKTPTLTYLSLLWESRVQRAKGEMLKAERALWGAAYLIEESRRNLTLDDYRAGYLEDKLVVYQDMVDLFLAQKRYDQAIAAAEHGKARILVEMIERNSGATTIHPDSAVDSDTWPVATVTAIKIGRNLPAGVLAISYAEVHDKVWAILLDSTGLITPPVLLGPSLSRADLERGLQQIQRIAHEPELTAEVVAQQLSLAQETLKRWFSAYLAPLQPWLERYPRVMISPDRWMNALPFACLYDEMRQSYFCETHQVALTPSLALWPNYVQLDRSALDAMRAPILVVGSSFRVGIPDALPAATTEARAVAELFPSSVLLTEQTATVEQFVQAAPRAPLIYIAAHGEYHLADPSASFIELADGPLRVRDILSLRLDHPIVVLNACDTNRGYLLGNEMMGLVRSFFYAGASAVIATQWQVEDQAAAALMTEVMRGVQAGELLGRALQLAQCRFIQRRNTPTAHPFFWGAVTLTGAGNQHRALGAVE